jgi:anaerobic magnesium-protoporphyrin IX monomethyl ester cyclase
MENFSKRKKVVLVQCGIRGRYIHFPLSILYLAESLLKKGLEVKLIDLRIHDLKEDDLQDALYVGISHMSGSMQIPSALQCARIAKSMSIPTVFGGPHSSMLTEQTAQHPLVDIAVRGDGEEVVCDLVDYYRGEREINSIKGIAYKSKSGTVCFTGNREPPRFNTVAHLPYDLLNINKYLFSIDFACQSSRGCPHRCSFCSEVSLFSRCWRAKPAEVVAEEVEFILNKFNPQRIYFVDSNFFCSQERIKKFCEIIINKGIKISFFAECRFDYFYQYGDDTIRMLKEAGFNEIEFGGESGSDTTLSRIKKDTNSEQIIHSIKKCKYNGLKSFTSFMIGFPGESSEEMSKTIDVIDKIMIIDPRGARINGLFIFTPYPGTELYDMVIKDWGYKAPTSLEEWSVFELYDASNITWLDDKTKKNLQTISTIIRYLFTYKTILRWRFRESIIRHGSIAEMIMSLFFNSLLYPIEKMRWRLKLFYFPIEIQLWQKIFFSYIGRK